MKATLKTNKIFLTLLTFCLLFTGVGVETYSAKVTAAESKNSQWKVFSSPDKSFTILMPGTPEKMSQTQKTFMGEVNLNIFVGKPPKQEVAYVVAYNDFPYSYGEMASSQTVLNNARDIALKTTQSKLISQKDIRSTNNHPGIEIEYVNPGGKITYNRMFFAQGRLYQAMVITTKKQQKYLTKSIKGYLNSFQVVLQR